MISYVIILRHSTSLGFDDTITVATHLHVFLDSLVVLGDLSFEIVPLSNRDQGLSTISLPKPQLLAKFWTRKIDHQPKI